MAEKKYNKYVTKMWRMEGFDHVEFKDKITRGPVLYDKMFCDEAPAHIEVFQIDAPGAGFGLGDIIGPAKELKWQKGIEAGEMAPDLPHKHPSDELFLYHGSNRENPYELGGELEFWLGEGDDAEQYIINEPTVVRVPAGVIHMPEYIRKVTRPFFKIVILLAPLYTIEQTKAFPPGFKRP
jgi:hypothetical protein